MIVPLNAYVTRQISNLIIYPSVALRGNITDEEIQYLLYKVHLANTHFNVNLISQNIKRKLLDLEFEMNQSYKYIYTSVYLRPPLKNSLFDYIQIQCQ